jgi:DNA-binding transcriptional MerR regulator
MDEAGSRLLTIGELAERVGVATSALRYYEEVGLLEPTERRAGRRHYHRSAIEVVGTILLLRDVGFTITEIGELHSSRSDRAARRTLLRRKLEELSRKAAEIDVARQALEHGLDCPAPDIITCPNFTAVVQQRVTTRVPWTKLQPEDVEGA